MLSNSLFSREESKFFWALPSSVKLTVERLISTNADCGTAPWQVWLMRSIWMSFGTSQLKRQPHSKRSGTSGEFGILLIHPPCINRLHGRGPLFFRSAQSVVLSKKGTQTGRSPTWGKWRLWRRARGLSDWRPWVSGAADHLVGLEPSIWER